MSVGMYVAYIPQIADNLSGHKGNPVQPFVAFVNCSLWTCTACSKNSATGRLWWPMCRASSLAWPRFSLRCKPFQAAFSGSLLPVRKAACFLETPPILFLHAFSPPEAPLPASGRLGSPFQRQKRNALQTIHFLQRKSLFIPSLIPSLSSPGRKAGQTRPRSEAAREGDGNGGSMTAIK